jgi:hypothetical protein
MGTKGHGEKANGAYSRGNIGGANVTNVFDTTFTAPRGGFLPYDAHVVQGCEWGGQPE